MSSTYTLTNVKDSDEFDKLKAALAAFDLVDDVRLSHPLSYRCLRFRLWHCI